jgi:hypothetical protein
VEADHEEITDQVGVDVLGSAPHVFLFKASHPFADRGFDFSLRFHDEPPQNLDRGPGGRN